jgi:PKD repeat protein
MNRFIKAVFAVLILTAMPLKQWAQTPYRPYADEGIVLNFFEIDNIDFRAFLLYNISQDNRFVLVPEDEYGQFILTSNDEDSHFVDEFESFYQDVSADFDLLTKNDIYVLMNVWKEAVAPRHFLSITMDVALRNSRSDNEHCANSLPFCTTDLIEFEAACTTQQADEPGMDDGCIGNSYNPSFYHMRIHTAGQFIIHMDGHDPDNIYQGRDIDFCMWGPYDEEEVASGWACSHLTSDKIIDCCYSADPTEDVYLGYPAGDHQHTTSHGTINYHMPEVGEYYILMITNYSRDPCVISFTKTPGSGPGETDCDILPGIVNNDGPYCEGETIHLTVNDQMNATYSWTGPNGFTSNEQNPIIPNCTLEMAGIYTCITTVGSQTTSASTEVVIYQQPTPNFTATTVCQGQATDFTGLASGSNVANYEWVFGDGDTGSGQNVSHIYAQAGTYEVTLTVTAEDGTCPGEITQTVTVNAQPVADAGPDQTLPYPGLSAQLSASGGGSGFTYQWEPANMVVNPNNPNTQTVTLYESQTYTLTVINPQGECTSSDQVTIYIGVSPLNVTAEASPYSLCEGSSTQLQVNASGGSGDFRYSWAPTTGLSASNISNPVATPMQTTTYTCTVSDNITLSTQSQSVTIIVNHPEYLPTDTIRTECDAVSIHWDDGLYGKDTIIYQNTEFTFFGITAFGCHREQTFRIESMEYTPSPDKIQCTTEGAIVFGAPDADADTIAVVTNTEFFSFQYTFKVQESGHSECVWDDCEWTISKPSWAIEFSPNPVLSDGCYSSECTVYVAEQDDNYVELTATMSNRCGSEQRKFYLKSSFLDVDENSYTAAKVNIVPNPNNGQMRINFDDMEGLTVVKVLDMTGNQIDAFETNVNTSHYSFDYTMKQYAEGIYLFVFSNNSRVFTKKVVIIQ